jgi:Tetracyclin repressor-like, C-terminal domain
VFAPAVSSRRARGAFVAVIERGQERGELSRSQDPRELVALIFGPLLYRRFFSREGLDEGFAKRVVGRALRGEN